ncbi:MAG TPA: ammonium transporter, partial [Gemmatimonadaceae bacterium]|nr:ammonium transporter [Gemmatimonadaceae bacterium]
MSPTTAISGADTAWVLISAALVMLMVPGLALFYGGLVRSRSSLNTFMMSLAPLAIVSLQWVLFGYSLAFASGASWIGPLSWLGFSGVGTAPNATYAATIPHVAFAMFQAMFAIITVGLIAGAVVERMKFGAYLLFVVLWTTLVYDPLAHWVWGDGGWLRTMGALDFAGGTVVHISAGVSALVAALMLGRRHDASRTVAVPHNVPFAVVGAGLLWFGWFGFNAGSALAASPSAALAFTTTFLAPMGTLVVWTLLDMTRNQKVTAVGGATAIVVGLVAITPAAGFISPMSALALGAIAAVPSYYALL